MNFYALVLNPGYDETLKVLRAMSVAAAASEVRNKYLEDGGSATIYEGNPLNPRHMAKGVLTILDYQ
jgi:hypothetical protein